MTPSDDAVEAVALKAFCAWRDGPERPGYDGLWQTFAAGYRAAIAAYRASVAPSDDAVEAAARALYDVEPTHYGLGYPIPWDKLRPMQKEHTRKRARAAIAAYRAAQPVGWQTMSDDAKTGEEVLLYGPHVYGPHGHDCLVAAWDASRADGLNWSTLDGPCYPAQAFTYWMPIPARPTPAPSEETKP